MLLMHEAPGGRVNAKAPLTIVVQEGGHHLVCILLDLQSRVLVFCSTGSFFPSMGLHVVQEHADIARQP
eukprot:5606345-Prorocentrum_lima.AAC.1